MLVKILLLICFLIALLIVFIFNREGNGDEERNDIFLPGCNEEKIRSRVVPTIDFELGTNVIYCASFQLAWQALKEVVGGDVYLTGQPGTAEKLNSSFFSRESLSENDYYVNFGFGKEDIISHINNDLLDRFGNHAPSKIDMILRPEDMFIYAYIFKNMEFKYAFDKSEQPLCFQSQEGFTNVRCYGINSYRGYKHQHFKDQVDILHYGNDEDFIIGLNCLQDEDENLLAKIKPGVTLRETYTALCEKIANGKKDGLKERDSLLIPYINIDLTREYSEIINRPFLNDNMKGVYISQALQSIKFDSGEKGAVVSSEAKIIFSRESVWNSRQLVFNEPFLVVLRRKGSAEPYLIIWIDDTELLIKA